MMWELEQQLRVALGYAEMLDLIVQQFNELESILRSEEITRMVELMEQEKEIVNLHDSLANTCHRLEEIIKWLERIDIEADNSEEE